ncbi:hypothetical protein P12x_001027 [Tundrisphaera lichenicola]|uniref:hypothetical protein n=1 Tax=Tundrisphaera lichenicola TaxID=2029860 RepID=UPI003EC146B8
MNTLDVPCPQCGSVEVVVGGPTEPPTTQDWAGGESSSHVPRLHICHCKNCRHTFQHDFAFSD